MMMHMKRAWTAALVLALLLTLAAGPAAAESPWDLRSFLAEMTDLGCPESAAALIRPIGHTETVNGVEITIREALYDGRILLLQYSFRLPEAEKPLGVTAAEVYEDWLPEGMTPDTWVYGVAEGAEEMPAEHGVGWWIDDFWIDGRPVGDMPDGSGQYVTGTGVPGELIETDIWRLDNAGIFPEGKVRISLPIGERQDLDDYLREEHPEKYGEDGLLLLPERGVVTFEFDAGDALPGLRAVRPETEIVLPEFTARVRETVFSPLATYIRLDLAVPDEVLEAYAARDGQELDEDGEPLWPVGPMDVFGSWLDSLQLTDAEGNAVFPEFWGPAEYSDEDAEFVLPFLETVPEALFLTPVDDETGPDLSRAVPVLPAE